MESSKTVFYKKVGEETSHYTWDDWYELASNYYEHYGNLKVYSKYRTFNGYTEDKNGLLLGQWIYTQRQAYKNRNIPKYERINEVSPLTDEQVEMLEEIGMIWDVRGDTWQENYKLLEQYYKEHGNLKGIEDKKLKIWIMHQRRAYKNRNFIPEEIPTNDLPLTDEQVVMLERIGMIWDAHKEGWEENYKLLEQYYKEHGNLKGIEDKKLKSWIKTQRLAYKNRDIPKEERKSVYSPLTDEQIEKLERIGMIWDTKKNGMAIVDFCLQYGINYKKYKSQLENISYQILYVKSCFLSDNNEKIIEDGKLHEIFFMSDINMKVNPKYNTDSKELITRYLSLKKRN